MRPVMTPQSLPPEMVHFDHHLVIRGVSVCLRVFPLLNTYTYQTDKPLSPEQKQAYTHYLRDEGFFDNPIAGSAFKVTSDEQD